MYTEIYKLRDLNSVRKIDRFFAKCCGKPSALTFQGDLTQASIAPGNAQDDAGISLIQNAPWSALITQKQGCYWVHRSFCRGHRLHPCLLQTKIQNMDAPVAVSINIPDRNPKTWMREVMSGLMQWKDFWGMERPKNRQNSLLFRIKCVSSKCNWGVHCSIG